MSEPDAGWSRGSKQRLTSHDAHRFAGPTLLDAVGRAVCEAGCLPRKELYESWEFVRRVLRRAKGGPVLDLASGHGLVGWLIALIDRDTTEVTCVDPHLPPSAARLHEALSQRWPEVGARITHQRADLNQAHATPPTRVLAVHACGGLTDRAIDLALAHRSRFAALPCCHSRAKLDDGGLSGWLPHDLAIDATRVARMRDAGYDVWTGTIPEDITPQHRMWVAVPAA